jgi:hypothetical protein
MRGRYPAGWEYMEHFDASDEAKERVRATVEILTGDCRVQEACAQLGLGTTRLEQVRHDVLAGALAGAERKRPGRQPRVVSALEDEVERLRRRVAELEAALEVAAVRAEVTAALPRVGHTTAAAEKKTPPRRSRRRRGKKKS